MSLENKVENHGKLKWFPYKTNAKNVLQSSVLGIYLVILPFPSLLFYLILCC